ncbi:MAG TPA: hypothetical protein PLR99_09870 [Polyangiaceae bacterium]|nr:hypothetical protein [Polyangiaceae bacterium]
MTEDPRAQLILDIEIALVDWKPVAQPHELSELAELLLDARDAGPDELPQVEAQFRGLERFVESRRASVAMAAVRPDD